MSDEPVDVTQMSSGELSSHITNLQDRMASLDAATDPAPAKETIFDHKNDAKLSGELGKIHDRAESREQAVIDSKNVPSARTDSFDTAFESTYNFLHAPKAEQTRLRDAGALVEKVKANAARFGVVLDDKAALQAAMEAEKQEAAAASSEHGQAAQHLQSAFRDSSPAESARFFSETKASFERDPIGTITWLGQQTGMNPMQLAVEIANRYGHQPQQHQSQAQAVAAMENEIIRVAETLPNYAAHEQDMLEIIGKGQIKRTNNPVNDLKSAYREAVKRDKSRSFEDKIGRDMSRIYDRKSGAK